MKQLWSKLHQVPSCCHCDTDQQRPLASQSSNFMQEISAMVDCHSGYQYWLTAGYVMLPVDATSLYIHTKLATTVLTILLPAKRPPLQDE